MNRYVFIVILALIIGVIATAFFLGGGNVILLQPHGTIAASELHLIRLAFQLMLIVVVPVFAIAAFVTWRYRESNTEARYLPNWEHNTVDETIWWLVPIIIITVLAVITWRMTHTLDPYEPLPATTHPLSVEVVSLNWKWLFIYPAQGVATINYLKIPDNTPIFFKLSSDAPMNAFFIPQLGSMEMTMPGMTTQLNLMADSPGTYIGMSTNYSGEGFAGMQFPVHVVSWDDFDQWVAGIKTGTSTLTFESYKKLAEPSSNEPPAYFILADENLYTDIVNQFMGPDGMMGGMHMEMSDH